MKNESPTWNELRILVRGAGEMATGVAHRLRRAGLAVAMTETAQPLCVRRTVSFCTSVWEGEVVVERVRALRVERAGELAAVASSGDIPVLVDPELSCLDVWKPHVLVDATLAKRNLGTQRGMAELVIGLGPGFTAGAGAGNDVDVVVETMRGHDLGQLIREGCALPDTGLPETVLGFSGERVLRAPADGVLHAEAEIGERVEAGQCIARVGETAMVAQIGGVLRGLLRDGMQVKKGWKAGDVDPRGERAACFSISDKARALGGSVLEAVCERFAAG